MQIAATQVTEDSSSANTSDSLMTGPHTCRFEPSKSDCETSGTSSNDDNSQLEGLTD